MMPPDLFGIKNQFGTTCTRAFGELTIHKDKFDGNLLAIEVTAEGDRKDRNWEQPWVGFGFGFGFGGSQPDLTLQPKTLRY